MKHVSVDRCFGAVPPSGGRIDKTLAFYFDEVSFDIYFLCVFVLFYVIIFFVFRLIAAFFTECVAEHFKGALNQHE